MTDERPLSLGEWACLGAIAPGATHGFAVAARLRPDGDLGRVWSLSRPLTYRAIDHVRDAGLIEAAGTEPGRAGGPRLLVRITRRGRRALNEWLAEPVAHLRDIRSELLVKLVLGRELGIDQTEMLTAQRQIVADLAAALDRVDEQDDRGAGDADVVIRWRRASAEAAVTFVDRLLADGFGRGETVGARSPGRPPGGR